jgi:DNA-binding response OmpR family regulator
MRAQPPDLLLTDVMMPKLDGFGLVSALRSDKALRDIPIVLLSARAGEEARIEGLDAGGDDYLTKPFSARELTARIGALLERGHMRRQSEQALRRRTAKFETLLHEAPLGVYVVDADFRIRDVNPAALSLFGNVADPIGREFDAVMRELWHDSSADEIVTLFHESLDSGRSSEGRIPCNACARAA